jgi:hypothetical protein
MRRRSIRPQHVAVLTGARLLALGSGGASADECPHFTCFQWADKGGALNEAVKLITPFSAAEVAVKNPHFLCAPTIKTRGCTTDQ